ncbi:MAG: tRNA (adenosine(37)-N6)-dimethylallyltransferase MiaA [Candidatus Moraniibacteriota bacterium]
MSTSSKIIVILGPTSSGKSSLAIEIAKKWNGEIISADSRQVYRGMDIGTGKVTQEEQAQVRHWLLDVADPNDDYNVSHFVRDARIAFEDIVGRNKLPILCGGTGFWIQALVENHELPSVSPDPALREALAMKTREELFEMLEQLNPERAETIDRNNPRRLVRAIEIAQNQDKESSTRNTVPKIPPSPFPIPHSLLIALCPPKDILDARIQTRLEARFNQGMIAEVEQLHSRGVSWDRLDAFGLEYRWISRFLRKTLSLNEMKERLFFDSIYYAKRQMTWIRRWQRQGASLHSVETPEEAFQETNEFMKKNDI